MWTERRFSFLCFSILHHGQIARGILRFGKNLGEPTPTLKAWAFMMWVGMT